VYGDTPVHTIVVDWDGTAVPAQWPDRPTTFMPGFVEAMRKFHKEGYRIVIFSARLSPYDPWSGVKRPRAYQAAEAQYIRNLLDQHGLTFVSVWTLEGKPGGSVYIDDKAERYGGRRNSWKIMTTKVLLRLGNEDAVFPAFDDTEV
jgi:hypothetical protein